MLNILQKGWSTNFFITKKRNAIEYMSAKDLHLYTYNKFYTNRFNLCTQKNDAPAI